MAQYQLLLPKMGESVAEATITKWVKNIGDTITIDESVVEIATDKVDSEVPSPVQGKLLEQLFAENQVAQVGDVIAIIETDAVHDEPNNSPKITVQEQIVEQKKQTAEDTTASIVPDTDYKISRQENSNRFYSPLVKSIALEEDISLHELDQISGTGAEGRVTKQDILDYVHRIKTETIQQATTSSVLFEEKNMQTEKNIQQPVESVTHTASVSGGDEIIEMDRMRKLIADHMVMSKKTSPHATSFVEVDVTNIVSWRNRVKSSFEKREGQKITFTPIFIEAIAKSIKDMPMINVSVEGSTIIKKRHINIGLATALPSGNLIVPVIKNADQLNLVGLTKTVNDLAQRARNNKLQPDEVQDGTFTLTNIGSFGNDMGIPIINQPQVAILAVGTIKKKPAVIETEQGDMIGIRQMMFLSLSYDHRVVDGALGGSFIKRVAEYLEGWDMHREI